MNTPAYISPNHRRMRLLYADKYYTGGGLTYELRDDIYKYAMGLTCEYNADIGCLDARETLPGGTINVVDYPDAGLRIVSSDYVPRVPHFTAEDV